MIGADIRTAIRTAEVTSLVGERVWKGLVPQTDPATGIAPAHPLIVYQRISGRRGYHLGGADGTVDGLWQITCWAESSVAAEKLADLVREELKSEDGPAGESSRLVWHLEGEIDDEEPRGDGSDARYYAVAQTWRVLQEQET